MVDEYQDTNHAQYVLVRELVAGWAGVGGAPDTAPGELCVVGDSDQSIYAFRGADIRNIIEFEHDFPDARTILLEQNYRSTQHILSAANAVIARNPDRRAKRLWSEQGDGEKVVGYVADNEHDEAAFVAQEIDRLVGSGCHRNADVAVFYRTNSQSRVFEDVFLRVGLPYKVVGGTRFYERKEIRDALAYLRVLANPDDTVSLRRILNVPKRGIGDRAEQLVASYADQERISFAAALRIAAEQPAAHAKDESTPRIPELATRSQRCIAGFVRTLDELRELLDRGESTPELLEAIYARTGYTDELTAGADPQDGSRLENLAELVTVAREFAADAAVADVAIAPEPGVPDPGSLAAFLERVALVADADAIPDAMPDDGDGTGGRGVVTLMTLHTAKGLEYPVVFVTGWEDGVFPHRRALADPAELAEERRLAYVGITRARERLYLSRALIRSSFGQPHVNPASRFLAEVPDELVDWRRCEPERSAPVGRFGFGKRPNATDRGRWNMPASMVPALSLAVGDRVNHDKYGLGMVVAADGSGVRATVTIDFGSAGTVRLMLIGSVPMQKL
jgi:DNA helicase-2/ATP-dependent DNA helicase PcrA